MVVAYSNSFIDFVIVMIKDLQYLSYKCVLIRERERERTINFREFYQPCMEVPVLLFP